MASNEKKFNIRESITRDYKESFRNTLYLSIACAVYYFMGSEWVMITSLACLIRLVIQFDDTKS